MPKPFADLLGWRGGWLAVGWLVLLADWLGWVASWLAG